MQYVCPGAKFVENGIGIDKSIHDKLSTGENVFSGNSSAGHGTKTLVCT